MNQTVNQTTKAFTLIELSIVLVIIGLIVGGVLVGKDLIEAARLRAQGSQMQSFATAYTTFKLKYNCIPGDCAQASQFSLGTDGDNNFRVDCNNGGFYGANSMYNYGECYRFFQHLNRSGLTAEDIVTYPKTKVRDSKAFGASYAIGAVGYGVNHQISEVAMARSSPASLFYDVNLPMIGNSGFNDTVGVFSPIELANIDTKIDDGNAASGKILGWRVYGSTEGDCLTGIDGNYLKNNNLYACMARYILE